MVRSIVLRPTRCGAAAEIAEFLQRTFPALRFLDAYDWEDKSDPRWPGIRRRIASPGPDAYSDDGDCETEDEEEEDGTDEEEEDGTDEEEEDGTEDDEAAERSRDEYEARKAEAGGVTDFADKWWGVFKLLPQVTSPPLPRRLM